MRVLLDIDGVIADFTGKLLEMYNHMTNEKVKISDIKSFRVFKWVKDPNTINRIIESPGFVMGLSPLPGAIDGVKEILDRGHEVVFVSNGTNCPTSGHEKRNWLKYHFRNVWKKPPLVLTYHKHFVSGDCLVDDNPKNLNNLSPSTAPLLWHQPYNANEKGYTRIYDWSHLMDWIEQND